MTIFESLSGFLQELDEDILNRLNESEDLIKRLDEIPGVGRRSAEVIIAEIGTDMGQFPSTAHLASWTGICPGNNQSAEKIRAEKLGKVMLHLKKL